jgi:hypothetical protein
VIVETELRMCCEARPCWLSSARAKRCSTRTSISLATRFCSFTDSIKTVSTSRSRRRVGKLRLQVSGPATFVGAWPFVAATPPPTKGIGFDQGAEDAFGELGDIGDAGEAGES